MSIKKKFLKSKRECKVTFKLKAKEAKKVEVAGAFNNWNGEEFQLKKLKNGTFKGSVNLATNNSYEFKYIVDGNWINDESADALVWNEYANSENSLIEL